MGAKGKGKRAWRKIDTQEVEDYLEKSTREERQGLAFEGVPDADLFFVDKGEEAGEPAAPAAVAAAAGKKGKRLTRAQAILQAAHSAKPVVPPVQRKKRGPAAPPRQQQRGAAQRAVGKDKQAGEAGAFDLWGEGEPAAAGPGPSSTALAARPAKRARAARGGAAAATARPAIPAVEVDLPGCSYNPDQEQHQDAIALAVATEMQKVYKKELEPISAPPQVVDYEPETDELAMLQVVEGEGEQEEEEEGDQEGGEGGAAGAGRKQQKAGERKTKKDRNREKRRREAEAEVEARRRLKAQRRELEQLKQLEREVAEQEAEREAERLRKQLDKQERMAAEPPKLGKQRFEPAPLQVLTTDEVSGSLRRLKPTALLAKDRFKSLQKRGVIEPRRKVAKKVGKKVLFEQGSRWEREREGQQEINEARKRLKSKAKQAKQAKQQQ